METQRAVQTEKVGSFKVVMLTLFTSLFMLGATSSLVFAQTTDEWDNDGTTVFPKPEFETVKIGSIPYPGELPQSKLLVTTSDSLQAVSIIQYSYHPNKVALSIAQEGPYAEAIFFVPILGDGGHNTLSQLGDSGIFFEPDIFGDRGLVIGPATTREHDGAMRITSNGNIGIGISEPQAAKLHVVNLRSEGGTAIKGESKYLTGVAGRSLSSNGVFGFSKEGYGGYFIGDKGLFTNKLVIGSEPMEMPAGYEVAVDGKLIAEEVTVMLSENWADFVFDDDYELMPLNEVEQHIKKEKHLPGIPTAEDVDANGVGLADMQSKLLQKIEELTLYVIDLKKENEMLKARVGSLENRENESMIYPE